MRRILPVLVLLLAACPLWAFDFVGDTFDGNSWGQRFGQVGTGGTFDHIQIKWVSGSPFEAPAFRQFSTGTWSVCDWPDAKTAVASGGPGSYAMEFDIIFLDPQVKPTSFYFQAYNGAVRVDDALATWNGGWSVTAGPGDNWGKVTCPAIPEPVFFQFGAMMGLGGVGVLRLRRKA